MFFEGKVNEGLKILDWEIELYPNDANLYDSRAEFLLENNKKSEAVALYKKAIKVLKSNKANYNSDDYKNYLKVFSENLEKTQKRK